MRPLSARERRLVAIGLLLAAIALVYFLVIGPFIGGFFDRADQKQSLMATYQRNERAMALIPMWRKSADIQHRSAQRFALAAASDQLAIEALKEKIARIAADEGYPVTAMQDLQTDSPAGEARVRADLQLSLPQLTDSLKRLETEGPYVVEYLSVSADRALATGRSSRLVVRLEVSAPWRVARSRPS